MAATLRYRCIGKCVVTDHDGATILELSVANKIPHWRECGGHARCTTCRVRVIDGLTNLSPRTDSEESLAKERGWGPSIRLACQAAVHGDVTLERMVRTGSDSSQIQIETIGPETGEERSLAMVFCDMRDFTSLAEGHSAFDVVHILNRLFAALGEPILLNGGIIYQYVGDEISGLFGLGDEPPERSCRAALRAALGMREAVASLNREIEPEFGLRIKVGVGVHFGPVIVGRVGHPARRQFSVVGDNVNMASRIQATNKTLNTDLLVSDSVIEHLPADALEIDEAHSTQLRGRQEPVRLHSVRGFAAYDHFLLVQKTLSPLLNENVGFSERLYARLFQIAPDLETLFVNGTEAQGQMLEYMVRGVIFGLGRANHLVIGLHTLGARHVTYGVKPQHFAIFRTAMLETIKEILGPEVYTGEVEQAWDETVTMTLNLMRDGVTSGESEQAEA